MVTELFVTTDQFVAGIIPGSNCGISAVVGESLTHGGLVEDGDHPVDTRVEKLGVEKLCSKNVFILILLTHTDICNILVLVFIDIKYSTASIV